MLRTTDPYLDCVFITPPHKSRSVTQTCPEIGLSQLTSRMSSTTRLTARGNKPSESSRPWQSRSQLPDLHLKAPPPATGNPGGTATLLPGSCRWAAAPAAFQSRRSTSSRSRGQRPACCRMTVAAVKSCRKAAAPVTAEKPARPRPALPGATAQPSGAAPRQGLPQPQPLRNI